ncbi:hypothetical protein BJI67_16150 (plasmid) [Acidihalobacter aeolianus]|uniref:Uncharacterized protein n=1 Tax=Acidihalobacter aeolianus TaxID=2792603 RepID=A0A1D8KCT6_9GAMM|nr:exodeoxyribonuclease VII small subunit [Acidihalobacter aeolianus]AOV18771.1 hypothetical protein BJI67_16150 [Acidihalobacter aeolianus]
MSDPTSFKEAYAELKANADRLRTQQEIDIDELVPLVERSSKAYTVVKERIESARKALAEHLPAEE